MSFVPDMPQSFPKSKAVIFVLNLAMICQKTKDKQNSTSKPSLKMPCDDGEGMPLTLHPFPQTPNKKVHM